jgi:four helix bundle protein
MNNEIRNPNIEIRNKFEYQNPKTAIMHKDEPSKRYDLEERTFHFARDSRVFAKHLPRTISNIEDAKQFVRASGSVGANYIEANECIGKKDFVMKIKTCRREAKEGAIGYACSTSTDSMNTSASGC